MHSDKARRIAFDALFAALALMFTFVEIKLPVSAAIPIPGFRLGLANIAVMAAAYSFSFADAAFTAILKIMLSSLLFSNPVSFLFSAAGTLLSLAVLALFCTASESISALSEYRQPALFFTPRANLPFPLHFSAERRFSAPYI